MNNEQLKFNCPYSYCGRSGSTITSISQTVPDMSLSVREILDRFTRGLPTDVIDGHYADDVDFDDLPANLPGDFDLSDIDDARQQTEYYAAQWQAEQQAAEEGAQQTPEPVRGVRDPERASGSQAD